MASAAPSLLKFQSDATTISTIPGDSPIDTCVNPPPETDLVRIESLVISPNPPQKGKNLTIEASGVVVEDIVEGAYVAIEVKYGLIRLIRQKLDLCEQTVKVDLECPIKKGAMNITTEVELPKEIPPGRYTVLARVFTVDDKPITCLVAKVICARFCLGRKLMG